MSSFLKLKKVDAVEFFGVGEGRAPNGTPRGLQVLRYSPLWAKTAPAMITYGPAMPIGNAEQPYSSYKARV